MQSVISHIWEPDNIAQPLWIPEATSEINRSDLSLILIELFVANVLVIEAEDWFGLPVKDSTAGESFKT